jgi:hypothetical protein
MAIANITPNNTVVTTANDQLVTVTNSSTYGSDARGDFGLVSFLYKLKSQGYEAVEMTGDTSDYETMESWTYTLTDAIDAHVYMVAAEKWVNTGGDYSLNEIVHDVDGFYICILALNSGTNQPSAPSATEWTKLDFTTYNDITKMVIPTGPSTHTLGGASLMKVKINNTLRIEVAEYVKNTENTKAECECFEVCEVGKYELIRLYYEGAEQGTANADRADAQLMFERMLELQEEK